MFCCKNAKDGNPKRSTQNSAIAWPSENWVYLLLQIPLAFKFNTTINNIVNNSLRRL